MILSQYSVRSVKLLAAYLFLLWRPDKFCKINLTVERKRNIINGWYLYFALHTLLHCCSPSIAVANTKTKHVMNPCEEVLPCSKMPCTASFCFHFRSKRNSKFKLTSGNDENTMRLLGHQLCHTELLQWNRLTVYRGNSSQLSSWKMLRSISGLQDMSILLKSTWFQSSQEYATHQSSTALNVHSEDHQMKEQKYPTRSRKYLNLQSQLQYFPYIITLLPFKHKNKKSLRILT